MSRFLDFRADRCAVNMSPAVEKTLSEGTLVPGIQRYCLANLDSIGKDIWCVFHQARGQSDRAIEGIFLYRLTSSSANVRGDFGGSCPHK